MNTAKGQRSVDDGVGEGPLLAHEARTYADRRRQEREQQALESLRDTVWASVRRAALRMGDRQVCGGIPTGMEGLVRGVLGPELERAGYRIEVFEEGAGSFLRVIW